MMYISAPPMTSSVNDETQAQQQGRREAEWQRS